MLAIDLGGDRRPFRQDNALYLPVRRCGVKAPISIAEQDGVPVPTQEPEEAEPLTRGSPQPDWCGRHDHASPYLS